MRWLLVALAMTITMTLASPSRAADVNAAATLVYYDAVGNETLGTWDFFRVPDTAGRGAIGFPNGATLLAVSLRCILSWSLRRYSGVLHDLRPSRRFRLDERREILAGR